MSPKKKGRTTRQGLVERRPKAVAPAPDVGGSRETGQIRERLLAAAEDVFSRLGLHGATTAMIAEAAGVSKPHIYYYFESKEALYIAVIERTLDLWTGLLPPADADNDPRAFLAAYIRSKIAFSRLHPRASRIFASEVQSGAHILRRLQGRRPSVYHRLVRTLEGWQAGKRVKPVDARHLVLMIWAMTQYYANAAADIEIHLEKRSLDEADYGAAERTILQLVFGALGLRMPAAAQEA